jgi:hypothetical protein
MDLQYVDELRNDLLTGMEWLDERRSGLGDELESEFFASISVVRDRPHSFAADENGYRPCRLKRFNAVLYYRIETDCILVVGLLVNGQDYSRLAGRGKTKRS